MNRYEVSRSGRRNFIVAIFQYFLAIGILLSLISGCNQPAASLNGVKIYITEEGVYRISADTLASFGLDIQAIDPQKLQLSLRGIPQPLYILNSEGSLWVEFFGNMSESQYSAENIYLLEIIDIAGEYTESIANDDFKIPLNNNHGETVYIETSHFEENSIYFPQVEAPDHWFWVAMSDGQIQNFPITLSELAPGDGIIRLGLWSNTEASVNPDHHLVLRINEQSVIDINWDGRGEQLLDAVIPDGILVDGENIIAFEIPGDTQAVADVNWINWFEVSYPRGAVAHDDQLSFVASIQPLSIGGFHGSVHIFDITEPDQAFLQYVTEDSGSGLVIPGVSGHAYFAVGEEAFLEPVAIRQMLTAPDLRVSSNGAEYLAIGPDEFLSSVEELLSQREAQGLKGMAIPVQAIYDQFNHGFPEPEAIRRFLLVTTQLWETAPKYVLLIGDASYDPRNYLEQTVTNILPSFFIQTQFGGETASDFPFSDLNEDGIPDIAVGRVPASSPGEVNTFVRKTLDYESRNRSHDNEFRLLAIADGQDAGFQINAQDFLNIFKAESYLELFVPTAGATDANSIIRRYFTQDYSFIAYFGHGSVVMWGKDRLFSVEDATNLTNTQYPILINMTCLTGFFTHPKTESLSEAFLFNPSGGAVAILAPTSLTLPGEQSLLSTPFGEALRDGEYGRLGDIYLYAQREMTAESQGARDVLETFLLFGDPGLVIFQD